MRSTAVRFICRVLIAIVALYAANDGLLQAYAHDGSDGIVRQMPGRTAMPVLAAAAGSEDDREFLPSLEGPTLVALLPAGTADPVGSRITYVAPRVTLVEGVRRDRPGARAPPNHLHASA